MMIPRSDAGAATWRAIQRHRAETASRQAGGEPHAGEEGRARRPLDPGELARFVQNWTGVHGQFANRPGRAVADADRLLGDVLTASGYWTSASEHIAAPDVPDHPVVVDRYRAAHDVALLASQGRASIEDLRQAMIHYRTLYDELVRE